ncbi:MAG TPA: phosphatidylserine decarboxylase [Candidatus Polarisedimenticolaceae bacterium]|nr:phosphatidylserine decarboxylase [Candidatus Polarisedimenticolaceae bacterium]
MRIAREALPFVAAAALATLAAAWWTPWAALPPLVLLAFTVWFFRDPERRPPTDPDVLVSPADGRVIGASTARVSIFMNVFDVHVCRAPAAGRLVSLTHTSGNFVAAFKDAASESNERAVLVVEGPAGSVRFALVAGLVARRIITWVKPGQDLAAGQRVGLIRFGSRVDVDLPAWAAPAVRAGDRVRAGISVLARAERRRA